MTAEEFVAKYRITGGAEWVKDDPEGRGRTYRLRYTAKGGELEFVTNQVGDKLVAPFTPAEFIVMLVRRIVLNAAPYPIPALLSPFEHAVEPSALFSVADVNRLRRQMGDDAMWCDLLTITALN